MRPTPKQKHIKGPILASLLAFLVFPELGNAVNINYDGYSTSRTINGFDLGEDPAITATYSATAFFRNQVTALTAGGVTFSLTSGNNAQRLINATQAGLQLVICDNALCTSRVRIAGAQFGGFMYNSIPFSELTFDQFYDYLLDGRNDANPSTNPGRGIAKANQELSARGGLQYVIPIAASTMQGSGFFPKPIGKPQCNPGDSDCFSYGNGIGLSAMCDEDWILRYLFPSDGDNGAPTFVPGVFKQACINLGKDTTFYPAVGGQNPLTPLQFGAIRAFEFVTPYDDLGDPIVVAFFPVGSNTNAASVNGGFPDFACNTDTSIPVPPTAQSDCITNTGQLGARYLHYPSWHQPYLVTWLHIDNDLWFNQLTITQRNIILNVAEESLAQSFAAANSQECAKLGEMMQFNNGIFQRNRTTGALLPTSADITISQWPQAALDDLLFARNQVLDTLTGVANPSPTANQQTAFAILADMNS